MRAAYVKVPFQVEIRDVPVPEIGPDEVLIKVMACGVCGTDLHFARDLAVDDYMPLGHEFVGVVDKLGSNVTEFREGDSVIVENHTGCGMCAACKNGNPVYCTNLYVVMNEPCMADFVKAHKKSLHKYDGLTPSEAALAEPLTVALDVVEEGGVPLGSSVAVFGPGPIGLMAVALVKNKGAGKVILTGRSSSKARMELGRRLGADKVVEVDKENLINAIQNEAPEGLDRVFVTSPPNTIPDSFAIARFGGVVVYNGIDFRNPNITFNANEFHFKRLQLRATHSIPNLMFPVAIDLIKRKVIDPDLFITHTFSLDNVAEALVTAENDKANVVKVMITVD